jgi:flagellin
MSFVIANNVASLTANHYLGKSSRGLNSSLEKLASGFKVNRGADGPAALVISEKQRVQIAGLTQAIDNAEKGISLIQTAEGALTEVNSLLVKIRSLAIDSANEGVNDADAQAANQSEIDNALDTIRRIAENTQFGIKKLLDGSRGISGTTSDPNVTFIKGTSNTYAGTYAVNVTTPATRAVVVAPSTQTTNLTAQETLTINGVRISLNAGLSPTGVRDRINQFSDETGVIADDDGSGATRLYSEEFGDAGEITVSSDLPASTTSTGFSNSTVTVNGTDIAGQIDGIDFVGTGNLATATSGSAQGLVLEIAASSSDLTTTATGLLGDVEVEDNSLVFHIGPNEGQSAKIAINTILPTALAVNADSTYDSLADISVLTADAANETLASVDAAIDEITQLRGSLGAFQQNSLDSTANSLRVTLENTVSAESVIRDTNFAVEIANFTKHQVLVQAGTSVLGNANQTSQLVLSLLN